MTRYYVNKNAQANGDHEVHKTDCSYLASVKNRQYLGSFPNCYSAVLEAKKIYPTVDGCAICSPECHTR
jgi:hypothetical protein